MNDIGSIVAKHADGGKLTKKEVEILRTHNGHQHPWEKVNLKKSVYYKYRKLGMPDGGAEALNWIATHQGMQTQGKGTITVAGKDYSAQDLIDLRGKLLEGQAENVALKNRLEELNLAEKEGRLMDGDALTETLTRILVPLRKALDAMPENLANALNPEDPGRAEQILQQELQNIYNDLSQSMKKDEQATKSSD